MRLRALRDACLGGFLYGSLLYGAVLSLIHVAHNHLGSARDALLVYGVFLLLYGLWARRVLRAGDLRRSSSARRGARLLLGVLVFNLFFWEVFFLYGLTYDQAPFQPPKRWWHGGSAGCSSRPPSPLSRRSVLGYCSGSSWRSGAGGA